MASILQVEQIKGPTSGASANTITIPSGQTLDMSNATVNGALTEIQAADMPAGTVLQVVQTEASSGFSTTNSTVQDTGHSASITPSSSSNKILVSVSWVGYNNSANRTYKAYLYRGATKIYGQHLGEDTGLAFRSNAIITLDSPSTTSSVTYTMFVGTDGVGTSYYNYSSSQGKDTIILMEIAG